MHFFYTTDAGLADFIALLFATAVGLVFGRNYVKAMAAVLLVVFLFDRTALALTDGHVLMLLVIVGSLAGISGILAGFRNRTIHAFAFLYFLKMLAYTANIAGFIGFETMITCVTVAAYGQMLLIIGGSANGTGILSRNTRRFTDAGRGFAVHTLARWGAISARPAMSHQINPQPATVRKENCRR